jgi:hypothetical protein
MLIYPVLLENVLKWSTDSDNNQVGVAICTPF